MEVNHSVSQDTGELLQILDETDESFNLCVDEFYEVLREFNKRQDKFSDNFKDFAPYSNILRFQTAIRETEEQLRSLEPYLDFVSCQTDAIKWNFEQSVKDAKIDKFLFKELGKAKRCLKYAAQSKDELKPFFQSIERLMKKFLELTQFCIGTEGVSFYSLNDTLQSKASMLSKFSVTQLAQSSKLGTFLSSSIDKEILKLQDLIAKLTEAKNKANKKRGKYFFDEEFLNSEEPSDRKLRTKFHNKLVNHAKPGTLSFEF